MAKVEVMFTIHCGYPGCPRWELAFENFVYPLGEIPYPKTPRGWSRRGYCERHSDD